MTQYIAAKSKNVLVYKENMFYWRGDWFPGLVDEENNALYDHPDDSFNKRVGLDTALELGKIIPIQGEIVTWVDKVADKFSLPAWFPLAPLKEVNNEFVRRNCYA